MKTECIGDHVKLKGKTYPCTVSLTMDLVGGKWKAVILYHLKDEPKRYNELRKELATVTEMTLSLQLKQLEKDGLVFRKVFGKKPPIKVVYSLTGLGKTFIPVLDAITEWGNQVVLDNGEFITAAEKES
ncbi:winged helix-turn-helix transcriptional regulator [Chryseobacterium sp. MIQD13]|uniref:winged helix-turn-helix transcriptional regulator n=1 Tax=Chryseobacterium sp. MIQD13 TaxID=3422310 RepID=UPI003D2E0A07